MTSDFRRGGGIRVYTHNITCEERYQFFIFPKVRINQGELVPLTFMEEG